MRLLFFTEARLIKSTGGKYYSTDQSFSYQMFKRYLEVFDKVHVVARTAIAAPGDFDEKTRVNMGGIEVLPLPHYIGPYQYLKKRNKLSNTLRNYIESYPDAAAICRVPGAIGTAAAGYLTKKNKPYGVEVVGDPRDVFAPGSFNHPLRAVFRYIGARNLKAVVKNARVSIYVTKRSLQARYPSGKNQFSTYASNVMLPSEAFVKVARKLKKKPPYLIVAVGTLAAMYKSPDVVIEALVFLQKRGLRVKFKWLGGGRYKREMIELSRKKGVADIIDFFGNVGSAVEVRNYLDEGDLFVLPSRQEGLPRAFVEAMARGLPCIGTAIGGIPELLDETALVPVNNPELLADKIAEFLTTPGLADAQAERNLKEAQSYSYGLLDARRTEFYRYVKGIS